MTRGGVWGGEGGGSCDEFTDDSVSLADSVPRREELGLEGHSVEGPSLDEIEKGFAPA